VKALAALCAVVLVGACGSGEARLTSAVPPPAGPVDRAVFVVLGGDETDDPPGGGSLTRAWEQLVFQAMPSASVLVDLSERRPTARSALREQLPRAQSLRPTVAAVWLGAADAEAGTGPDVFRGYLSDIVTGLQGAGARKVLLITHRGESAGEPGSESSGEPGAERFATVVAEVGSLTGAEVVGVGPGRVTQESVASVVRPRVAR
jgi:hypothetical protein